MTEDEYERLCKWAKCEGKDLNEELKKILLRLAKTGSPRKKRGSGGAVDTKGFERIRSKVNNPAILALLLAANLTTPTAVRRAGKAKLREAGLSDEQADIVLEALS